MAFAESEFAVNVDKAPIYQFLHMQKGFSVTAVLRPKGGILKAQFNLIYPKRVAK